MPSQERAVCPVGFTARAMHVGCSPTHTTTAAAADARAAAVRLRQDDLHVRSQGGRGLHDQVDLHGPLHHADAAADAAADASACVQVREWAFGTHVRNLTKWNTY